MGFRQDANFALLSACQSDDPEIVWRLINFRRYWIDSDTP